MPAWITSLLREDVTVPMPSAASRMITSRPAWASRRATARPITPAPITTHSTWSIRSSNPGLWAFDRCGGGHGLAFVRGQSRVRYRFVGDDLFEQPDGWVWVRFRAGVSVSEAFIMSGQLP